MSRPTQNLGPIGSAVLTFIGYKQTNRQTNRQTDKLNLYIDKRFTPLGCKDIGIIIFEFEFTQIR